MSEIRIMASGKVMDYRGEVIVADNLISKKLIVYAEDETVEFSLREIDALEVDGRVLYTADMGGALWY